MALFREFLEHRGGNFAVIMALGAVPLIFATGAGLDVSRMYSAQVQLQQAIDSAALSVVKESGFDKAAADAIAERMVLANFGPNFRGLSVELSDSGARVSAEVVTPTTLTAVFGYKEMTTRVTGTVEYPQTRYEIGLVLDTTGSMAGTKLAEMKKAAAAMVDELSATPLLRERVRFALVPFSTYVNVGGDRATASWIDTEGLVHLPGSIIPSGVSRTKIFRTGFPGEGWKGCVEARIESGNERFSVDDTTPSKSNPRTLFVPMLAPDEPADTNRSGRPLYPNNFTKDDTLKGLGVTISPNGTVSYLQAVLDVVSYLFYGNSSDPQGPNNGCSARPLTPLTADVDKIKSEITQLKAEGSTNITEGMAWGARVLSPGEPFSEGLDPEKDVKKIIVLLTDGDNTMTQLSNAKGSAYSAYGYLSDWRWDKSYKNGTYGKVCQNGDVPDGDGNCSKKKGADVAAVTQAQILSAMNADTLAACDSAKTAGQEVYTIRLEVNTTTSSTLLSQCASDPAHYYDAKSASDLPAIFDAITQRILKLRITS
jgi:Flp pilus assembly protein TadG